MKVPTGYLALMVMIMVFSVYLGTMADGVTWGNYGGDSGELIAVAYSLGIAHPTGYPLYTLLGRAFTVIPLGSIGFRVTLLSALSAAGACGLLVVFLKVLTGSAPAALLGALALGFSKTLWGQASIAEVYPLHLLLMVSILSALFLGDEKKLSFVRRSCLVGLLLGLGFANHMTTVLIVPAVAIGLAARLIKPGRRGRISVARGMALGLLFFFLGTAVYSYLPLRGGSSPSIALGPAGTLKGVWEHVTGKQFRGWMFSRGAAEVTYHLSQYRVMDQFSLLGGVLGTIGAWEMAAHLPLVFFPLLTLFLADLFYAVNYMIPDIEPYFIPSYLVVAAWMAWGARSLLTRRWSGWPSGRWRTTAAAVSSAVVVLLIGWFPYHSYNRFVTVIKEARKPAARHYARTVFQRLPRGALLLSIGTGETFSLWHRQACIPGAAEKNIAVVLRTYLVFPWYVDNLASENPELDCSAVAALARSYIGRWGDEVDFMEYRRRVNALTMRLIEDNFPRAQLYLTNEKLFESETYFLAQAGPVYRVLKR